MKKPTKKFISFTEWDKESLNKAVKKAESLGATKMDNHYALDFEWTWVLVLGEYREYFTSGCTKEELLNAWHEEIFWDEPENWVEPIGREMEVWDDKFYERDKIFVLCNYDWRYHDKDWYIWDNAQEIPTQKHIVECTDDQWEEIQNILNK